MRFARFATLLCWAVVLFGCGNSGKASADSAIKGASDAYATVQADARKYLPDQAKGVEDAIAFAKATADKGDSTNYAAAVQQVNVIQSTVSALATSIAARKAELGTLWNRASTTMPPMLDALQTQVDALAKSKTAPAGVTKAAIEQAKSDVKQAKDDWKDATTAAGSQDYATAMAKADSVHARVTAAMKAIGMQTP